MNALTDLRGSIYYAISSRLGDSTHKALLEGVLSPVRDITTDTVHAVVIRAIYNEVDQ